MNRLLLDTHTFLWFVWDDSRLSTVARTLIGQPDNEIVLSIASVWEVGIKISTGKLALALPIDVFFSTQLQDNRMTLLPIELSHVARVATLPFHHRDPFDRLLVAQCLAESVPLISADSGFDAYGIERRW